MRSWLQRLWPRSLAGQMIALLLLALVAAQGITLYISLDERRQALRAAERAQVVSRLVSVVRLLGETPAALSPRITKAASGPRLEFWLARTAALDAADPQTQKHPLQRRIAQRLADSGVRQVLVYLERPEGFLEWRRERREARREAREQEDHEDDGFRREFRREHAEWHERRKFRPLSMTVSVRLVDGRWLNAATLVPFRPPAWAWPSLLSMGIMAVAITLIVIFSVRRITRPLRALASAAEGLGRGQEGPPLAEQGPADLRQTIEAFNRMQERLGRFVQDRTRMLAAISHDLRTPITTLRLRAEFVEDPELRAKILETLEEMQAMAEATLAFVREDAAREDTRQIELTALIQSLCDDLADAGKAVIFAEAPKLSYACRPLALKRALANLVENAVAYGQQARVTLLDHEAGPEIRIEDDGPGIPEDQMEQVFEPFLRLEVSRSRETGGVGLGLAIARSIVRGHGGDITLVNRPEGGLRVSVQLPAASTD